MGMAGRRWGKATLARAGAFVAVSTVALTAAFLGIVGLLTGSVTGITERLPFYVLVTALAFVGAIVLLEESRNEALQVLVIAGVGGLFTFLLVTFGGEGVTFLLQNREEVVASQLLFYILAAGLIGTGLGYWALNHWPELSRYRSRI